MSTKKIGLVVEGGGMKCAYGAGVLDRFLDKHISFDYCVGVSAGAANAASFLAGQRERNLRFYTIHVKDPKYISFRNYIRDGQIFGLQYIYGTMSNSGGIDPLDYEAVMQNPCEYEIVATDGITGKPKYFNKNDLKKDDFTPIMASCALPVFCKPVQCQNRYYYDGGVSDSIPVQRAFDLGCDKVITILSKPRSFVKQPEEHRKIYSHKLRKFPGTVRALDQRHVMYRKEIALLKLAEEEGRALVFAPDDTIKISTFTKDPAVEQQLYDHGVRDFNRNWKTLEEFLKA